MRKALVCALIFGIALLAPYAQIQSAAQDYDQDQGQDQGQGSYFDGDQLDNLVAPVALYPDPLLAQVLVAATFPDQIDEADREMRAGYDHYQIDYAPWDVSVKAVAHYPTVLHMMADRIDWTTSLGQAYVNQSTDVMNAVQRLREQARDLGNLVTGPQQEVVYRDGLVYIYPVQPQYIYVPQYDPAIVYVRRPSFFAGVAISFGAGFAVGAWLNHDCDWREHRVFYHGWNDNDDPWVRRSRPYVHVTNVYINNNYRTVVVNRTIVNRTVNYRELNHYNYVHHDVDYSHVRENRFENRRDNRFDNRGDNRFENRGDNRLENRGDNRFNNQGNNRFDNRGENGFREVDNRNINRNINVNDPHIDANRGRWQQPQSDRNWQSPQSDHRWQPPQNNQAMQNPGQRWQQQQQQQRQEQMQRQQQFQQQQFQRQQPQNHSIFGGNAGFDARQASQRGQESRQQFNRPNNPPQQFNRGQNQQPHYGNARQGNNGHENGRHK